MEFTSPAAQASYDALVGVLDASVIGLDFNGTLAPVVEDPTAARLHPDAPATLIALAGRVRAVAVITGRPARQAIAMGDLDPLGQEMLARGTTLFVFGQYGNERWSAKERSIRSPRPPTGLASFERELPALLRKVDLREAYVEEKGLAVAVHTRRLADPDAAFDTLVGPIRDLAHRHGLSLEPGRHVLEVRSGGMHKGHAVHTLAEEQVASGFLFAGDDLGDVEAFKALGDLRAEGIATMGVCSASDEESALVALADAVVPGPDGVIALLGDLADAASRRTGSRSTS